MAISMSIKEKLNRLREKVEKIINGTDTLFEDESFVVAVANFMMKKETYIKKISLPNGDYELCYDLDKGRVILRDLLFLYFYVSLKMSDHNGLLPTFKAALENHQKTYNSISGLNENTCLISGGRVSQLEDKHAIDVFSDPFVIDVIRDAVVIVDMIRNSFGHNEEARKCYYIDNDNLIKIKNDGGFADPDNNLNSIKNYLDLEIPFEYISKFGEGIEPRNSDIYMMELADLNAFLISSVLKYDDVFKTASVDRLHFLYNLVENDNSLLNHLPKIFFSSSVPLSKIIYLFERCDIHELKKLPVGIYSSRCTVDRILKLHNFGRCRADYYDTGYSLDKIDVELMSKLPDLIFTCSDKNLDIVMNLTDPSLYGEDKRLKVSDISSLPRFFAFSAVSKKRVDDLLLASKNIEEFLKIPSKAFSAHFSDKKLSLLIGCPPDVTRLYDIPAHIFSDEFGSEKLEFLMGEDRDVENLKYISKKIFSNKFSVEGLRGLLNGKDVKEFRDIDFFGIRDDYDIKNLSRIWGDNPDLELLKKLPSNFFDNRVPLELTNLLVDFVDSSFFYYEFVRLVCFPTFCFDNLRYVLKFDKDKSNYELLEYIFSNNDVVENLLSIPRFAFSTKCKLSRLDVLLGENKDFTRLQNLPPSFFASSVTDEKVKFLLSSSYALEFVTEPRNFRIAKDLVYIDNYRLKLLCGDELEYKYLLQVPDYVIFNYYENKKLEFFMGKFGFYLLKYVPYVCFVPDVSMDKIEYLYNSVNDSRAFCNLSFFLFDPKCSIARIHYLLGKCDNNFNKINELPKELFFCDDDLVDALFDVSSKNLKVKNDLYSHLDEKNKALLIYANGLFSVMDRSVLDYSLLDYTCLDFNTSDSLFEGVTHIDVQTNMKTVESLCSSYDKFLKVVDNNRLSFTRIYQINSIKNMSGADLVVNFKQWERDFKDFFDRWLLKKLIDSSKRTTDNVRNVADHLRFMQLPSGDLGIFDEETKKNDEGSEKRTISFAARTKTKSLFKSISLIHNQVVNNDYTKFNNCDTCFASYMKAAGVEEDYYDLKNRLSFWIDNYINKTRRMCVSLYYLKSQPTYSNVTAIYHPVNDVNIKYVNSGANVCFDVDTWYNSISDEVLDNDIATIDNLFKR